MKITTQSIEKYKDYKGHVIRLGESFKNKSLFAVPIARELELNLDEANELKDFIDNYDYSLFAAGKESIKINETVIEIQK